MLFRTYVWVEASMASWQHPTASPPGTPSPCSVGRPARLCARFPGGAALVREQLPRLLSDRTDTLTNCCSKPRIRATASSCSRGDADPHR
jgi:hypothetical protein